MKKSKWFRPAAILVLALAFICGASSAVFAEGEGEQQTDPTADHGIPLVIVRVDESTATIDDMNGSDDHSVRCEAATIEIKVPDGYKAPDGCTNVVPGVKNLKYIRGRGNSTWDCRKKPYKVELREPEDFFGMGESTDWALLANAYDTSLMRNRLMFWLGEQMGLNYTPQQVPVDLVMIGTKTGVHKYGSYCLCETIKIEENRINIGKLKKNDKENITGGYLMATYSNQDGGEDPSTWFTTNYGVDVYNDSPDFMDDPEKDLTEAQIAQREYIRGYIQEVEDLIMKAEMKDGKITAAAHDKIAEKMDLQSAADFWLLQEIPLNTDGYATTSTYFYKARDGKLCWGPLWDFDYAFWNNSIPWTASRENFNNTSMLWIDYLRENDPQFASLLKERWAFLNEKLQEMTRDGGIIEQYEAEVRASREADFEIWKDKETGRYAAVATNEINSVSAEDFNANIGKLKTWTENRRIWAEANKDDMNHVYCTAIYMAQGKVVATELVRYGTAPVMDPDVQAPEGYVLAGWMKGRQEAKKVNLTEDTVFRAKFLEEDEAVAPEKLDIQIPDFYISEGRATMDISREFFPGSIQMDTDKEVLTLDMLAQVEPYRATNSRITWTSSNEKVGTIDPVGHRVILKAGGETTITGTLYNGVSGSFVLHVNGPAPEPDPVSIQDAKVTLSAAAFTYNGKVQKPAIKSIGGQQLAEGTDYEAVWSNASSKNAGTYSVSITGKGLYEGTAKATYVIKKAANPLKVKGKTAKVKAKKLKKKKQVLKASKLYKFTKKAGDRKTYTLLSAKKGSKSFKKYFKVNKKNGKMTVKKGLKKGTYKVKVKVKAAGNSNYKAAAKKVTVRIKVR